MSTEQLPPKHVFWKELLLPTITVALAVFGAWQGYQNYRKGLEMQEAQDKLSALRLELDAQLRNDARENGQRDFMLQVFQFVQDVIKERDSNMRREAAALALVDTLPDTEMKLSLSRILKEGAESPEVRRSAAEVAVAVSDNLTNWGKWDIDVFSCDASGDAAQRLAVDVMDAIRQGRSSGRVRVKSLTAKKNAEAGYRYSGLTVAYNKGNEDEMARRLMATVATASGNAEVTLRAVRSPTPWYLSVFVCPAPAP